MHIFPYKDFGFAFPLLYERWLLNWFHHGLYLQSEELIFTLLFPLPCGWVTLQFYCYFILNISKILLVFPIDKSLTLTLIMSHLQHW